MEVSFDEELMRLRAELASIVSGARPDDVGVARPAEATGTAADGEVWAEASGDRLSAVHLSDGALHSDDLSTLVTGAVNAALAGLYGGADAATVPDLYPFSPSD